MLQGERVVLRPVRRSDVETALKWFNDPDILQYLNMYLPMTEMQEEKFIEYLGSARDKVMFMVETVDDEDPKAIGSVELENINHKDGNAMFAIAIGEKEYWGQGHGTEAAGLIIRYGFEQLNLHRIYSVVFSFNERSLRLHRKLDFIEEAREREAEFKNGQYHDRVVFGILREDWLMRKSKVSESKNVKE
ncbi:MAG: GNAT family N-acetyltransferase [Dehalococcoidales bacterium]|nr:GNAT family N-acetyltransferase [Dehalococcoidales bacterium]